MNVLLCGGGTAGHVMPAVAIGELIIKNFPEAKIAFAGRENADENRAYIKTGYPLYTVNIQGLGRSLSINTIKSIFKIILSGRNARRIVKEFKPDLIIGTGGYVCYPFVRQGQRMKVKTVLHESNVYPGLVTRILHKKCNKVLLNLEGAKKYLKYVGNVSVVGNPVRVSFNSLSKNEARRKLGIKNGEIFIVSFGGSLGASKLNEDVSEMLLKIKKKRNIRYLHATGKAHYSVFKQNNRHLFENASNIKIVPYIEDMPTVLKAADLAITRSGAMTISELCECATPSILIPSPNVTANHQYINAKYMKDNGASELIEEKDLTPHVLFEAIESIINDPLRLDSLSKCARSLSSINADNMIVDAIRETIYGKQS